MLLLEILKDLRIIQSPWQVSQNVHSNFVTSMRRTVQYSTRDRVSTFLTPWIPIDWEGFSAPIIFRLKSKFSPRDRHLGSEICGNEVYVSKETRIPRTSHTVVLTSLRRGRLTPGPHTYTVIRECSYQQVETESRERSVDVCTSPIFTRPLVKGPEVSGRS